MKMPDGEDPKEVIVNSEHRTKVGAFISDQLQVGGRFLGEQAEQRRAVTDFEARPYQLDSWNMLSMARKDGAQKGLIRLATGLGKTSIAVFDYAQFRTEQQAVDHEPRALFVVHRSNILSQASDRFGALLPHVGRSRYNSSQKQLPTSEITFTTFQSLVRSIDKFPQDYYDYIVYDEAHHIEADTYKKVVDHFQPQFQLGLTATPHRMDTRDIRLHFGEPLYSKTLPEAIQEKYLAEVVYNVMMDDTTKEAIENGFNARTTRELRAAFESEIRNEEIVQKIKDMQKQIRIEDSVETVKTIVFCEDIEHSDKIAELLNGESYHSELPKQQQLETFKGFVESEFETITVRDMFNEGVDIPDARLIVFLRSTQSKPVFEQQLGRGLRRNAKKNKVVVMDFVANIDRLLMLEELWTRIFKEGSNDQLDKIDDGVTFKMGDEGNLFVFDKKIIDLLDAYKRLAENEHRTNWFSVSEDEIIERALRISPDRPLRSTAIQALAARDEFPGITHLYKRFGSMSNFQQSCGFEVTNWRTYTADDIVTLALELSPDRPIGIHEIKAMNGEQFPTEQVITNRFGNITNFQIACGFNIVRWPNFSNEDIVQLALQLSPDKPLLVPDVDTLSRDEFPSAGTIKNRFGSMKEFHEACGFKTVEWASYSDQDIVDLALSISPNNPLRTSDLEILRRDEFPPISMVVERFGSLGEFHKNCGFNMLRNWHNLSNEELVALALQLSPNEPLSKSVRKTLEKGAFPGESLIRRQFGSIDEFYEACGFNGKHIWSKLTNEELIELAKKVSPEEAMTQLTIAALDRSVFPGYDLIRERFGSLTNFQKACGFEVISNINWQTFTNQEIVDLALQLSPDKPLSVTGMKKLDRNEFPNQSTIFRRFGSMNEFQEACGFQAIRKRRNKEA